MTKKTTFWDLLSVYIKRLRFKCGTLLSKCWLKMVIETYRVRFSADKTGHFFKSLTQKYFLSIRIIRDPDMPYREHMKHNINSLDSGNSQFRRKTYCMSDYSNSVKCYGKHYAAVLCLCGRRPWLYGYRPYGLYLQGHPPPDSLDTYITAAPGSESTSLYFRTD